MLHLLIKAAIVMWSPRCRCLHGQLASLWTTSVTQAGVSSAAHSQMIFPYISFMLDDPKIKSLYQVKIGYSKCLDDYTDYARPLSRLCGEVMGSGSWVFQISTYRSSSFAAHGRELHLHLLPPRIVTLHWVMVHWVIHGHPLKLRGTSVSCSRNSELLWFFMKSTKSVFPDAKKHGAVKKDEALPHDNHDISKKKNMFKQCLNNV